MKLLLLESRLFNRNVFATILVLFLTLFVSWFVVSSLAEILFMDYGAYDLPQNQTIAENRAKMLPIFLQQTMSWENALISSMSYLIHFIPLFFIFPTLTFIQEQKCLFVFGRNRFLSFSRSMWWSIIQHSLIAAFITSMTLIIFHGIIGLFLTSFRETMTYSMSFIPYNFFGRNPFLFFAILFSTIYFVFGFTMAFLFCGVMLWIKNPYYGISGFLIGYYLYFYIGDLFDTILNLNFRLFWLGDMVTAFNTFSSTSEVLIPLIPLISIAIGLTYFGIKRQAQNVNA